MHGNVYPLNQWGCGNAAPIYAKEETNGNNE